MQKQNVVCAHWVVSLSLKKERCCPARMNLKDSMTQKTTYHPIPSGKKPPEANPERPKVEKWLGWRAWGACSRDTGFPFTVMEILWTMNATQSSALIQCISCYMNFTSSFFEMLESLQGTLSPPMEPRVIYNMGSSRFWGDKTVTIPYIHRATRHQGQKLPSSELAYEVVPQPRRGHRDPGWPL